MVALYTENGKMSIGKSKKCQKIGKILDKTVKMCIMVNVKR